MENEARPGRSLGHDQIVKFEADLETIGPRGLIDRFMQSPTYEKYCQGMKVKQAELVAKLQAQ